MKITILSFFLTISGLAFSQEQNCSSQITGNIYACGKIIKNKKEGAWVFYKGEKVVRISYYKNDSLSGPTTLFYDNGHILRSMKFLNNDLEGNVFFYAKNGELVAIYEYSHDLFLQTILLKAMPETPPKGHSYYPLENK